MRKPQVMVNDVVNVVNANELHFLHFWLHLVGSSFPNQGWNPHIPCLGMQILNQQTTRKVPCFLF